MEIRYVLLNLIREVKIEFTRADLIQLEIFRLIYKKMSQNI